MRDSNVHHLCSLRSSNGALACAHKLPAGAQIFPARVQKLPHAKNITSSKARGYNFTQKNPVEPSEAKIREEKISEAKRKGDSKGYIKQGAITDKTTTLSARLFGF